MNGAIIPNHGFVLLDNIGEYHESLLCLTDNRLCCGRAQSPWSTVLGDWYYPNGTGVANSGNMWEFYRNRGQSVVRMNRRRGGVNGIYRCVIPDAAGVNQTIYIGVYTADTGEKQDWDGKNSYNRVLTLWDTLHNVLECLYQLWWMFSHL